MSIPLDYFNLTFDVTLNYQSVGGIEKTTTLILSCLFWFEVTIILKEMSNET